MRKALKITAIITLVYFLLTTAFYIPYYNHDYWYERFEQVNTFERLGEEKAKSIFKDMKEYWDKDYFGYERTHLISSFSEKEQRHLKSVKKIIDWICILYYIAILTLILTFGYLFYKKREEISTILLYGGASSFGIILLAGIISLIDFNFFWNSLHQILFSGNWTFQSDSLTIQLFGNTTVFFSEFTETISIIALILSGITTSVGYQLKSSKSFSI